MYYLVYMSGTWYSQSIERLEEAAENITIHVDEGNPVLLVDELGGAADMLNISVDEIVTCDGED